MYKLYRTYKRFETRQNKKAYNTYKNALTTELRNTEKQYYQENLLKNKNNLKKTWSIIKSVISRKKTQQLNDTFKDKDKLITDNNLIVGKFNDYFINVGTTLAASIPKDGPNFKQYLPAITQEAIFINPTSQQEVLKIISELRNSSPGHDEITLNVIKPVLDT